MALIKYTLKNYQELKLPIAQSKYYQSFMNINKKNKIHIIGIGGIGMSGIAEILHGMGYKVQGSDISKSKNVLRLNKKRIKVYIGHNKKNIINTDIIIHSSAIEIKIQK